MKRALVLKGMFSKATYGFVLTYQISSFQHNSNNFQTKTVISPPPLLKMNPLQSTTSLGFRPFCIECHDYFIKFAFYCIMKEIFLTITSSYSCSMFHKLFCPSLQRFRKFLKSRRISVLIHISYYLQSQSSRFV